MEESRFIRGCNFFQFKSMQVFRVFCQILLLFLGMFNIVPGTRSGKESTFTKSIRNNNKCVWGIIKTRIINEILDLDFVSKIFLYLVHPMRPLLKVIQTPKCPYTLRSHDDPKHSIQTLLFHTTNALTRASLILTSVSLLQTLHIIPSLLTIRTASIKHLPENRNKSKTKITFHPRNKNAQRNNQLDKSLERT